MIGDIECEQIPPYEYKLHVQRLYNAVEHLFGWLQRISLANKQPPGTWIQDFINDVIEIGEQKDHNVFINQPSHRIMKMRRELDIAGFAFIITKIEDEMMRISVHHILVGLYFPPEHLCHSTRWHQKIAQTRR